MIRIQAVNNVVIVLKDRSKPVSTLILPDPQPQNMFEIPEPYTGVIDSVGEENEWNPGDKIAFSAIGGIYMKVDEKEYVVITPDMIIGKF